MNIPHYKDLLLKEQDALIEAMKTMGQLGEIGTGHWETHTDPTENKELEKDALADKFEEETTNEGVLDTLEERLKEITDALERVEKGTYGKCKECGKEIEAEKLEANPATTTCLQHTV
jgi:RNA polymerase-binding transcription factor DksA